MKTEMFSDLVPALADAVADMGIQTATSIQRVLQIPIEQGSDVVAVSPTGSGKTLGYALPLLQRWALSDAERKPATLIVLPTRELTLQTLDVIQQLTRKLPWMKVVVLHGGVSINPQLMSLRGGADVVLATPGRLVDVITHNALDVSKMSHLVLDEADRLLDEGFSDDIASLMQQMTGAQKVLVSATFSPRLRKLSARRLNAPVFIDESVSIEHLAHRVMEVDRHVRTDVLLHVLGLQAPGQALVFTARHVDAEKLSADLCEAGVPASALHGKLSQAKRTQVMNGFLTGEIRIVVATDLASRGLDVPCLPLVINFDLPRSPQDYLHRAGRSARAGRSGQVISLVDAESRAHMSIIEKRCDLEVSRERIEGFEPMEIPSPRQLVGDANGGIKGRRPSKKDRLRAARAADNASPE